MADESILAYRRKGFPKRVDSDNSFRTDIEYIGPYSTLESAAPALRTAWGDYDGTVSSKALDPIEGTNPALGIMSISMEYKSDGSSEGTKAETSYEIEWADSSEPLYKHPVFAKGGANELSGFDIACIERWKVEEKVEKKKAYKFKPEGTEGGADYYQDLSDNAKLCAVGMLLGLDPYIRKYPIARRQETYENGPPPESSAGQKQAPESFPNLPSGYEWRRSADRGLRAGGQTKWDRSTEWIGGDKVLIDNDEIFYTAADIEEGGE